MKWIRRGLLALVALVVLVIATLAILTVLPGSHDLEATVEINKSPEAVWAYLADPTRHKEWVSWLEEVHPADPAAEGVGAKEMWVMADANQGGKRMEIHNEVTTWEHPRLMGVKMRSDEGFQGTTTYTLTPLEQGRTALTMKSSFQMEGVVFELMMPIVMPSARAKAQADLDRLRDNLNRM